ncbi:MAG: hypothetical protein WC528_04385 [Patescibacteria group bacterium]
MELKKGKKNDSKPRRRWLTLIFLLFSLAFMVFCGYLWQAWTGFPKGVDSYVHMTRIKYVLDFFPHIDWQYHWANGMLLFSYASIHFIFGAILVKLAGISAAKSLIVLALFSYSLMTVGIFAIVYQVTKKAWPALLAVILTFSSFGAWNWMVMDGNYPRLLGLGFMFLAIYFYIKLLSESGEGTKSNKKWIILSIIFLFSALVSHVLAAMFGFLTLFFLTLFSKMKFGRKFKYLFMVILSSFALASFFYFSQIIHFFYFSGNYVGAIGDIVPMKISYVFQDTLGIGFLLLPLLLILVLVNIFLKPEADKGPFVFSYSRYIWSFIIMLFLFLTYAFIGYTGLKPQYYSIRGFIPFSMNILIVIFSSLLIGIMLGRISVKRGIYTRIFLSLMALVIIGYSALLVWRSYDTVSHCRLTRYIYDSSSAKLCDSFASHEYVSSHFYTFPEGEDYQHRFAPYDAYDAIWFNYAYKIPQERDYHAHGVLYPDWRYWFEQVVWKPKEFTMDEAKSAFDWFAIRWFGDRAAVDEKAYANLVEKTANTLEDKLAAINSRYLKDKDFSLVKSDANTVTTQNLSLEIEVKNPSQILAASNTPTILYIGGNEGYNPFFFNLTLHNYNSQDIIPVKGEKYVDSYRLNDLKQFDAIFLYSYQYKNKENAYSLLKGYVEGGGNLIWEAWNSEDAQVLQKETNKNNIQANKVSLPEPSPVSELSLTEISGEWDFQATSEPIFGQINFTKFSPPKYLSSPWKVAVPTQSSAVRNWAKVILSSQDHPVMISGQYGQGHILWTGFNFNYHITDTKNFEEAKLLISIIKSLVGNKGESAMAEAKFINPDLREISLENPAKGVLFRESFYPNWRARLSDGQKLAVLYAGPGLMYVPLPENLETGLKVILYYDKSLTEKIGSVLSLVSLLIFLIYVLEGWLFKPILSRLSQKIFQKSTHNLKNWWAKDEDE